VNVHVYVCVCICVCVCMSEFVTWPIINEELHFRADHPPSKLAILNHVPPHASSSAGQRHVPAAPRLPYRQSPSTRKVRERERERERELVGIQASAEAALVVYRLEESRKDSQIALPPKCHVTHLWPYTRPYTRQASVVIALVVCRLEGIVALEGLLRLSLPFCPF